MSSGQRDWNAEVTHRLEPVRRRMRIRHALTGLDRALVGGVAIAIGLGVCQRATGAPPVWLIALAALAPLAIGAAWAAARPIAPADIARAIDARYSLDDRTLSALANLHGLARRPAAGDRRGPTGRCDRPFTGNRRSTGRPAPDEPPGCRSVDCAARDPGSRCRLAARAFNLWTGTNRHRSWQLRQTSPTLYVGAGSRRHALCRFAGRSGQSAPRGHPASRSDRAGTVGGGRFFGRQPRGGALF